jgi:threonine 3-dehydrogenase
MARNGITIPKTMLAVVKEKAGPGAVLQEYPVPSPGPGEVLVEVKATAICGTDVHIYGWNAWASGAVKNFPQVMGHEFCGKVAAVGEGVQNLKPGDKVAGETHIPCGRCFQCQNGLMHICSNMTLFGVSCDGCFAQYTVLPEICARPVPKEIPWELGAIMEPLGTSIRSAMEVGCQGGRVLVAGAGPIGLGCVAALKAFGASDIIVTDPSPYRLSIAQKVGADICIDPTKEDAGKIIRSRTDSVGVDSFIDASGNTGAIKDGFRDLRKGGTVVLVGLPSEPITFDATGNIIFKEACVKGVHGRKMFETWTVMERMMQKKLLNIEPVITHSLPLEKFEEGFRLLEEGRACKVILVPGEGMEIPVSSRAGGVV